MKIIPAAVFVFLLLLVTAPDESEGAVKLIWFVKIAKKLKVKLKKHSYYARCNTPGVPDDIDCPDVVFGVGLTRNQAQNSARLYASTFGDRECALFVTHCEIHRFFGK